MTDRKTALEAQQGFKIRKGKLLLDAVEREGRGLTADENRELKELEADVEGLTQRIGQLHADESMNAELARLTDGMFGPAAAGTAAGDRRTAAKGSLGEQFVSNERLRDFLKAGGHRVSGQWASPVVELTATTLSEGAGSGAGLAIPDQIQRIVELPTRPLTLMDLLAPGTTTSNAVAYMKETTATNAAAAVAEGAAKPESTVAFTAVSEPVKKIATWIPATEEILDDVPTMRAYLDARLRLFVDLTTDDQLLNGSGLLANVEGFLARAGLATSIARVAEANADIVLDQIMAIWTGTSLQPTGIVMNPANWKTLLKTKDSTGQYYGGSPFSSPHAPTLWGLPVALTTAIAAGTCLVGAFRTAAQWFERTALRVDISNSHADFFIENKIAIRAERRGALAVYRPGAFGTCTNLS